jgi:signal transduction histidine kinase/L-asparagine transporter-like permease
LTALLSATVLHEWYLPWFSIQTTAVAIILFFTLVNLCGIKWAGRCALPLAFLSAILALISALAPVLAGKMDWQQAASFQLTLPFPGWFGALSSAMAGLFLVGFAAPAFEAATGQVGETIRPEKNVPRAVLAGGLMASVYLIILPLIWLGTLGPDALGRETPELVKVLGPTFVPILGSLGRAAAVWFILFNLLNATLQPLAGASRTLSQLAEDGLVPEILGRRSRTDAPWAATLLTAGLAIGSLCLGVPLWLLASANFTYLIGIALPGVAVWLLRRNHPELPRPYRAPRGLLTAGVVAAGIWGVSAILGFQQFGLTTVFIGLALACSGIVLYAWRKYSDRCEWGQPGMVWTLHFKLTGVLLLLLLVTGAGYWIAWDNLPPQNTALLTLLSDIFVATGLLTLAAALLLPGMIAHSAEVVTRAAHRLAIGTLADFPHALQALGRGDFQAAQVRAEDQPVPVHSQDELGELAGSFNQLQAEIARNTVELAAAGDKLSRARAELVATNQQLEQRVNELTARLAEREQAAIQLRQAKETAEHANHAKNDFLAVMSHEIRTPMNGVLGFANLLQETQLDGTQHDYVSTIAKSAESLLVIINDILDFSRIESGKLKLNLQPMELRPCLQEALAVCQPGPDQNLKLQSFIAPEVPRFILGDAARLRQVLVNLVSNGVKFTAAGAVTVRVTCDAPPAGETDRIALRISVTDTGIGIPPAKIPALFQPFSQVDNSTTRKWGGTGLGLAISKTIVELMGGNIWAESRPGEGSTFTFTLPVRPAPDLPQTPDPLLPRLILETQPGGGKPSGALKILLVEDIAVNRELTLRMLEVLGCRADAVANGRQCLDLIQHQHYDLILMDLYMPEMDGFTAAREIRRVGRFTPDAPPPYICALTANIMARDRAACTEAEMDDFLGKPLRLDALRSVLINVQAAQKKRQTP